MSGLRPACALALAAALGATGCTPVGLAIGAASSVGVAVQQEGGIGGAVDDAALRVRISDRWLARDEAIWSRLSLLAWNGRVLVMGRVATQAQRAAAIADARAEPAAIEVIDAVTVGPGRPDQARDYRISTELRARLALDRAIDALNVSLETHDGVIHVIGVARSPAEIDRIVAHGRSLRGVREIKTYVRVAPRPPAPPSASPPPSGG